MAHGVLLENFKFRKFDRRVMEIEWNIEHRT